MSKTTVEDTREATAVEWQVHQTRLMHDPVYARQIADKEVDALLLGRTKPKALTPPGKEQDAGAVAEAMLPILPLDRENRGVPSLHVLTKVERKSLTEANTRLRTAIDFWRIASVLSFALGVFVTLLVVALS